MSYPAQFSALIVTFVVSGCGGNNSNSQVKAPGDPATAKSEVLDAGAAVIQARPPLEALNSYLDGFHFYNGRPDAQMEAHHYCSMVNEEVTQCIIYDGNVKTAKIMGVEYIISEKLFVALPEQEKALWHSHVYEVKSGQLIAPGLPQMAEHELMKKMVSTYGKTWHTWHTDHDHALPLGIPQLMMGFVADGQANAQMIAERDQRFGINSEKKKNQRLDIAAPAPHAAADAWRQGVIVQLENPTQTQP